MPIINKFNPLFPALAHSKIAVLQNAFQLSRHLDNSDQSELSRQLKTHTQNYYHAPQTVNHLEKQAAFIQRSCRAAACRFWINKDALNASTQLIASLKEDHRLMSANAMLENIEVKTAAWGPYSFLGTLILTSNFGASGAVFSLFTLYSITRVMQKLAPETPHEQYDYIHAAEILNTELLNTTEHDDIITWLDIKPKSKNTDELRLSERNPSFRI